MQRLRHKRYLAYLLLGASFAMSAASASSQERRPAPTKDELPVGVALQCPIPQHIHLTAPPPNATPNPLDFPTAPVPLANWNESQPDKHFRHTFTWKTETDCCQVISGKLTLKYKALVGGPAGSSTAVNDTVGIYTNHAVIAGTAQPLYPPGSVTTGQMGTKTIALTAAMLANNRLSFLIQDDTSVISATLDVDICCVRK